MNECLFQKFFFTIHLKHILHAPVCRCQRLGLQCLSYLWQRDQDELLEEMIDSGVNAVMIKVAALGMVMRYISLASISQIL